MIDTMKDSTKASDMVVVEKKDIQTLLQDKLDFGFDSIYFRYATLCDELADYKAYVNHTDVLTERKHMNHIKMHFYNALEQLVHAHDQEEKVKNVF